MKSVCLQLSPAWCSLCCARSTVSVICARLRFTIPVGNTRQCLLLSLETFVREGGGREGRGQSGESALDVAIKRSIAEAVRVVCFFRKSKG